MFGAEELEDRYCNMARRSQFKWDEHYHAIPDLERKDRIYRDLQAAAQKCALLGQVVKLVDLSTTDLMQGVWFPQDAWMFLSLGPEEEGPPDNRIGYFENESRCEDVRELMAAKAIDVSECLAVSLFWNEAWIGGF